MAAAPPRRWGWHELSNSAARRLVAGAAIPPGALALDLGAGRGAITAALVSAGARVIAVELHPARAQFLRTRFAEAPITVVQTDIIDLRLPRQAFYVVANPPFAAISAVLRRLVAPGSRLAGAHLIVPGYVARRWTSASAPGRQRWQGTFTTRPCGRVRAHEFQPPASRDAWILVISRSVR